MRRPFESDRPPVRPTATSVVGMCEDRLDEVVEHARLRADEAARVGVDVPGAQLVQRRRFLVGEVQHVAPALAVARALGVLQHLLQYVGEVSGAPHGVELLAGNGVFLERELGLSDIPAIDVRNQCSGFIYGLSVADAWIRTGQYRRVLLVGAEVHSRGLDRTTRGRDTTVLFGDGAGVAILGPTDDPERGVLSTHLFADGRHAEKLWVDAPGLAHDPFISEQLIREGKHHAVMEGREVFKYASILMPQSVAAALEANHVTPGDVKLLVPHQANLRIIEMVQKAVGLRDDQVYTNIDRYGNTTAASIPIALDEALCEGRLARGDLLLLTAFGSGFTWASAAVRW